MRTLVPMMAHCFRSFPSLSGRTVPGTLLIYGLGTHSSLTPHNQGRAYVRLPSEVESHLTLVEGSRALGLACLLRPCPGEREVTQFWGRPQHPGWQQDPLFARPPPRGTQLTLGGREGQRPGCLPIREDESLTRG